MPALENSLPEQSENIYQSEVGTSFFAKLKPKWPVVLGVLGSITIFAAIIFAVYSYNKRGQEVQLTPTPTTILTPIPTPMKTPILVNISPIKIPLPQSITGEFSKRFFDPGEKFMEDKTYPSELTSMDEKDLIGLRCTPRYFNNYEQGYQYHDPKNGKYVNLTDNRFLTIIQRLNEAYSPKQISAISECETKDGQWLLQYEVWVGAGGDSIAYFNLENNDQLMEITNIPNPERIAYFVCDKPLQLTKTAILYYLCGGGDAGVSEQYIYKIDLNNKTYQLLLKCNLSVSWETGKVENAQSKFTCTPSQEVDNKDRAAIEELIASFEGGLNLAEGSGHTQENFFSFFTEPKTPKEQEEKNQLFCEGAFPCLWVSTSSLTGVSRYELVSLEKITDEKWKAEVKEWVIGYSAPDGEFVETGQRTNPLVIVKEEDKWLIESYGEGTKYMGIYK